MNKAHDDNGSADLADFDFDEWSDLARQDPEEFERRRRRLLQAELAKGSNLQREHMAAVLDAYEERVRGMPSAERLQVASEFAFGSLNSLQDELITLADSLSTSLAAAQPPAQAGDLDVPVDENGPARRSTVSKTKRRTSVLH